MDSTRASLILRLPNADDVAAWDEFANIYAPVVFRVAVSRGFQTADAENLVQEVLLSVARSVSQWLEREQRGSFRSWLLCITRNAAVDMLTRRATRPFGQDGEQADRILAQMPAPSELSRELDLEYDRAVFHWAASQVRDSVAEHTWAAFWLTSVQGESVDEVSKQLGMRPGNIYFARSRVMSRIKKLVQQYETDT